MSGESSWDWSEGDAIAPGRTILRSLGGGSRYEVALVWDDDRFALFVAKVLRPHVAEDADARRDLELEAEALAALSHPVILRGFDAVLDGPQPHLLVEHLEGPPLRRLLKAEPTLAARAADPARAARRGRARLHGPRGLGAPRHQARQPDHGRPAADHRPLDRADDGARRPHPRRARHGRLHGARAVRDPGLGGPDRPGRRRLRALRDPVAGRHRADALPARARRRAGGALPAARRPDRRAAAAAARGARGAAARRARARPGGAPVRPRAGRRLRAAARGAAHARAARPRPPREDVAAATVAC